MDEPEPVFGCHIQDCASETSYPADMLAVAGKYVICEDCYKNKWAYWVDSGVGLYVPWHELPRFIPKADREITALQAQVAELEQSVKDWKASMVRATDERDEIIAELEKDRKSDCIAFFQWWWNQPGSNTADGYDEWVEAGRP